MDDDRIAGRYRRTALLGSGGMGVVHAVEDALLDRIVALKTLLPELEGDPRATARFRREARIAARLDHPGIVPVHDLGEVDGRPFLTMSRVDGSTLRDLVDQRVPARRLLEVLRAVGEAVAFAHDRGIVHRDLKPDNIMIGRFGEVRVMDWGLAREVGDASDPVHAPLSPDPTATADALTGTATGDALTGTATGDALTGTPAYLAPEQASGNVVGPPADVYTLALILVELVDGRRVRDRTDPFELLVQAASPVVIPPSVPDALAPICARALSLDPAARPTALALAEAVGNWLRGEERADLARARLDEALAADARVERSLAEEDALLAWLRGIGDDRSRMSERWDAEDRRRALQLDRALAEHAVDRTLGLAIAHAPELAEPHQALAGIHRRRCERAEREGRWLDAARSEAMVGEHDRGALAAWLHGDGWLTLATDPPARATLWRLEERLRRFVPTDPVDLGTTPVARRPLARGSWLAVVDGPRGPVHVPIAVGRGEHWDGVPPGAEDPHPIPLDVGQQGGEAYVPPGWFTSGGDPEARHPRPRDRVWVDGFLLRVHPVTHGEYLTFLHDLVDQGRGDEADVHVPHDDGHLGRRGALVYRKIDGRYALPDGDEWSPDLPVFQVDRLGAGAYAAWEAARTGLPWRLPSLLEREKAGRGVDGRLFPWGNAHHPDWSNVGTTFAAPRPLPIREMPLDESVYGVRGLAGNVSDWLLDGWRAEGPEVDEGRAVLRAFVPGSGFAMFAGGAWNSGAGYARCTSNGRYGPGVRIGSLGFRLARSQYSI